MSDILINYKGSSIATMDASGTKTLGTKQKYCEDDIEVVYTKPAGPSGGGGITIDEMADMSKPSGAITIDSLILGSYAFAERKNITSVTISNDLTSNKWGSNAFLNCTGITSLSAPNLTQIKGKLCNGLSNLATVSFPKVTLINGDQSIESTKITTLVLPALTGGIYNNALRFNTLLTAVDLNACTSFGGNCFSGCTSMNVLVIRGSSVPTLGSVNSFTNTPFADGNAGGTLYVPENMIASYQAASNWATILGYTNNSIHKIEGTTYATHYVDGTAIPT